MRPVDLYHARIVDLNGGYRDIRAGIMFAHVSVERGENTMDLGLQALLAPSNGGAKAPADELTLDVYDGSGYVRGARSPVGSARISNALRAILTTRRSMP